MRVRRGIRSLWPFLLVSLPALAAVRPFAGYDSASRTWTLSNDVFTAQYQLDALQRFQLTTLALNGTADIWQNVSERASSPINFSFDQNQYNSSTAWTLQDQSARCDAASCVQTITLRDAAGAVEATVQLSIYSGQPVVRHEVQVRNLTASTVYAVAADMLPYRFTGGAEQYRVFRVDQWAIVPEPAAFGIHETTLQPGGATVDLQSGAHGLQCSWMAVSDSQGRGIFAGWEFDGVAIGSVRQYPSGDLRLSASIGALHHPVGPGGTFRVPGAFVGLYHGDWDEAGYRTQLFVEAAIARPVADTRFPYVAWDSWAYGEGLSENAMKTEAWRAAQLGIELFIIDLGWARRIGDWTPDPQKFPNGLKPVADYVHSLGMKFGIHFAFEEADPASAVVQAHPDWLATDPYVYYGAAPLCLSHRPVADWVVSEAIRIIDDYGVDWILQDGENMVKLCEKKTHTHDPDDSNYSNSVDGLNAVLDRIQAARPNVMWENCENGGNMQTFSMTRHYVTSITNDASGAGQSRQAVFGSTYPFPPRYADRYQTEDFSNAYNSRSYMFGGPWHLMNRTLTMPQDQFQFAQDEIALYKRMRGMISLGKVFHIAPPDDSGAPDVIQSYRPDTDSAVAVVCRDSGDADSVIVKLKGFDPLKTYVVTFADDPTTIILTGAQLMEQGVAVPLPEAQDGEVVFVKPYGVAQGPSLPSNRKVRAK